MRVNVSTKKQLKVKKITENILVWVLCPVWFPIVILLFVLTIISDVLENIVLDGSSEFISTFANWFAKKVVK